MQSENFSAAGEGFSERYSSRFRRIVAPFTAPRNAFVQPRSEPVECVPKMALGSAGIPHATHRVEHRRTLGTRYNRSASSTARI